MQQEALSRQCMHNKRICWPSSFPLFFFSSALTVSLPSVRSSIPVRVLSGLAVLQVSCGSRHTLAVVEGGVAYSWGWGACGQVRKYAYGRGEEGSQHGTLSVAMYCGFGHFSPYPSSLTVVHSFVKRWGEEWGVVRRGVRGPQPRSKRRQSVKPVSSLSSLAAPRYMPLEIATTLIFVVDVDARRADPAAVSMNNTQTMKRKQQSWGTGMTTGWDLRRK